MTLSSKQIGDIANLYENIIASQQVEQLNEDLIGDVIANRKKIAAVGRSALQTAGKAGEAITRPAANTARSVVRGAPGTLRDVAKGFQYGGSTGAAAVIGTKIAQGIMGTGKNPSDNKVGPKIVGPKIVGPKIVGPKPAASAGGTQPPASGMRPPSAKTAPTKPAAPAAKPMDQWRAANPKLAAAADEKARIRGTQQTDNPLMKDMRSRLPMNSPSVQAPAVAKLGAGNQSLTQNPNAFKAAPEVKKTAAIAATPKPAPVAPTKTSIASSYEYEDAYDLVLEYLFDNGHVDTVDEAHYVMLEMDSETIADIVGEVLDEAMSSYDKNRKRAAQRAAARNAARDAGKTGAVPGVGYVTPRREKETYRDSAGVERHTSGARMPQKDK